MYYLSRIQGKAAHFTVLGLDVKAAYEEQKIVTYLMITTKTLKKNWNTPCLVNTKSKFIKIIPSESERIIHVSFKLYQKFG